MTEAEFEAKRKGLRNKAKLLRMEARVTEKLADKLDLHRQALKADRDADDWALRFFELVTVFGEVED